MIRRLQSELRRAMVSTFEELGFVCPEFELSETHEAVTIAWAARVSFSGPVSGALEVRVSEDVAGELAANMLGLQDVADAGVRADALGEIANVVCGNVVPSLGQPTDVFDLSSPDVYAVEPDSQPPAAPAGAIVFAVGEGRAELFVEVSEAIAGTSP